MQNCLCSPSPLVLEWHTRLRAGQQVCLRLLFGCSPMWELSVLELLQVRAAAWPPCGRGVDAKLWICCGEHSYFFSLVERTQVLAFSSFFDWWFLVFCARLSLELKPFTIWVSVWGSLGFLGTALCLHLFLIRVGLLGWLLQRKLFPRN